MPDQVETASESFDFWPSLTPFVDDNYEFSKQRCVNDLPASCKSVWLNKNLPVWINTTFSIWKVSKKLDQHKNFATDSFTWAMILWMLHNKTEVESCLYRSVLLKSHFAQSGSHVHCSYNWSHCTGRSLANVNCPPKSTWFKWRQAKYFCNFTIANSYNNKGACQADDNGWSC